MTEPRQGGFPGYKSLAFALILMILLIKLKSCQTDTSILKLSHGSVQG